jgi:hypothetical protein
VLALALLALALRFRSVREYTLRTSGGKRAVCYLSGWQTPIDAAVVKKAYGSPANYVRMVEARLKAL